ncbi:MAG: hypothetical protein K2I42_06565 [Anaeroplasmataceae bacterium]|nr:hypothetical protein [Anaeroplasmataceae bacterium]
MKKDFIKKMKKGLGSAHIELYQAEDKEAYKEALMYACLHDMSYSYVEESKGKYLYDLICVYQNKENFLKEIQNRLFTTKHISVSLLCQYLDLLVCFYLEEKLHSIKDILWQYYRHLLSYGRWTDKKYLCFECVCFAIDDVCGIDGVKKIFADLISFDLDQTNLANFIFSCVNIKYKGQIDIHSNRKHHHRLHTGKNAPSFHEFLNIVKERKQAKQNVFHCLSIKDFEKAQLYLQKTRDLKSIKENIKEIQFSDDSFNQRYVEELFFKMIGKYDEEITEEIYFSLSRFKSKRVEELGLKLIESKKTLCHGLLMLMQNYKIKYKKKIEEAYQKVRFSFHYDRPSTQLLFRTIDFMDHTRKEYPDQILFYAYSHSYDSFHRKYIIECMIKRNLLTNELKEELFFDSNEAIQEFIQYVSLE